MSDTREDLAINKIAEQARLHRDPFPCDSFRAMSESIPLCDRCGWDVGPHLDQIHDEALEMDAERREDPS
ncbi:MAG: hypothetical protein KGZ65_04105 [Sphingomonadales bacterium]|nr:hypothetical protein [Sphingomonadaceae bacterium]MBS3930396.1 hypothetical protein [Sphingomonadales bacterium]